MICASMTWGSETRRQANGVQKMLEMIRKEKVIGHISIPMRYRYTLDNLIEAGSSARNKIYLEVLATQILTDQDLFKMLSKMFKKVMKYRGVLMVQLVNRMIFHSAYQLGKTLTIYDSSVQLIFVPLILGHASNNQAT